MEDFVGIGQLQLKDPQSHANDGRGYIQKWSNGLLKRDYFAALAMQGLTANSGYLDAVVLVGKQESLAPEMVIAGMSIRLADALIKELSK